MKESILMALCSLLQIRRFCPILESAVLSHLKSAVLSCHQENSCWKINDRYLRLITLGLKVKILPLLFCDISMMKILFFSKTQKTNDHFILDREICRNLIADPLKTLCVKMYELSDSWCLSTKFLYHLSTMRTGDMFFKHQKQIA